MRAKVFLVVFICAGSCIAQNGGLATAAAKAGVSSASWNRILADGPGVADPGGDLCKSIQNACALIPGNNGGIVDATGDLFLSGTYSSTVVCTVNMLSGCGAGTDIYLPPVTIQVSAQQATGNNTVRIFGTSSTASTGTTWQATGAFPTTGCVIGTTTILTCPIFAIGKQDADIFGVEIANMNFDLNSIGGLTAIASINMQERSWLHDLYVMNVGGIAPSGHFSSGMYFDATLAAGSSAGAGSFDISRVNIRGIVSPTVATYGILFKGNGAKPIGVWTEINTNGACVGNSSCGADSISKPDGHRLPVGIALDGVVGGTLRKHHNEGVNTALRYGGQGGTFEDTKASSGVIAQIEGNGANVDSFVDASSSSSSGFFTVTPTGGSVSASNCAVVDRKLDSTPSCAIAGNFTSDGVVSYQCCGHSSALAPNFTPVIMEPLGSTNAPGTSFSVLFGGATAYWSSLPAGTSWAMHCYLDIANSNSGNALTLGMQVNGQTPQNVAADATINGVALSHVTWNSTKQTALGTSAAISDTSVHPATIDATFLTGKGGTSAVRVLGKAGSNTMVVQGGSQCTLTATN